MRNLKSWFRKKRNEYLFINRKNSLMIYRMYINKKLKSIKSFTIPIKIVSLYILINNSR